MEFAQILKNLMDGCGYTNYRLAKLLDCSQSTVAGWLAGSSKPGRAREKQIAELFNVSVDYLHGKKNPTPKDRSEVDEAILAFIHSLPVDRVRGLLLALEAPTSVLVALDRAEW